MAWSTERTYIAATPRSIDWLRAEGMPYYHLRPPAVPAPVLALAVEPVPGRHAERFHAWAESARLADPEAVRDHLPPGAEVYGTFPDREELLGLKWLAEQVQSPVAEYAAETWGGQVEYEWCWEFGPNERVLLNAEHTEAREEQYRDRLFRRRMRTVRRSWRSVHEIRGGVCHHAGDVGPGEAVVLVRVLESLGVSTTGFFRPHLRGFDWREYRVEPGPPDPANRP